MQAVAEQAQANRRTAAALRTASMDVDALRELMLAWWGGMAAEACSVVISNFVAVLVAAADALTALSDFDAALLTKAVATRVEATGKLLANLDQDTFIAWWDQAMADINADVQRWHEERQLRVQALDDAARALAEVPQDQVVDPDLAES